MTDHDPRADPWQPALYHRFQVERSAPLRDLLAWLRPHAGARAIDLGCGTGELTHVLHAHLGAAHTTGLDSSPSMLARATAADARRDPRVNFVQGDIGAFHEVLRYDVVFSHAALHWVPDHPALFARLVSALRPGGQLAVQMPANHAHVSQTTLRAVTAEPPFADALAGHVPSTSVLAPAEYSSLLYALGLREVRVARFVYGHVLESVDDAVTWMRGTTMTPYERALEPTLYAALCARLSRRLHEVVGDPRPYYFTFERLLLWARRPE